MASISVRQLFDVATFSPYSSIRRFPHGIKRERGAGGQPPHAVAAPATV